VILAVLNEAEIAGARLHSACHVIGVSARTIQRWKRTTELLQMLPSQTCLQRVPFDTDVCYCLYRRKAQMAKAIATKRSATRARPRRSKRGVGWVRKNVVMDQRKLDVARRALGVDTETEAIDQALDSIAFGEELAKGFAAVRRSGGVDDVLESRRRA
jgi:hypothetical protein